MKESWVWQNKWSWALPPVLAILVWSGYLGPQQEKAFERRQDLEVLRLKTESTRARIQTAQAAQARTRGLEASLATAQASLAPEEAYLWMIKRVNAIRSLRLEVTSEPHDDSQLESMAYAPYKTVILNFRGRATYPELVTALVELETKLPYMKMLNFQCDREGAATGGEKFNFTWTLCLLAGAPQEETYLPRLPLSEARLR